MYSRAWCECAAAFVPPTSCAGCQPDDEDEVCDHEEYEVDWEGRATCNSCHETWWLTAEQYDAYLKSESEWAAEYDRMQRRERSRFWRMLRAARGCLRRIMPKPRRLSARAVNDDEIPF